MYATAVTLTASFKVNKIFVQNCTCYIIFPKNVENAAGR